MPSTMAGNAWVVAPFTGAWIEIAPSKIAGLFNNVAPFTGAWIEISDVQANTSAILRRSLHGGVD